MKIICNFYDSNRCYVWDFKNIFYDFQSLAKILAKF